MALSSNGKVNANKYVNSNPKTGNGNYRTFDSNPYGQTRNANLDGIVHSSESDHTSRWKQIAFGALLVILSLSFSTIQDKSILRSTFFRTSSFEESRSIKTRNSNIESDSVTFGSNDDSLLDSSSDSSSDELTDTPSGDEDDEKINQLPQPFSTLSPYDKTTNKNAKVPTFLRPRFSQPGVAFGPMLSQGASITGKPLPTNIWYQNLLLGNNLQTKPSANQQVNVIPYVIDFVGPIPGIRIHSPYAAGGDSVVQWTFIAAHGLTLGKDPVEYRDDNWAYRMLEDVEDGQDQFSPLSLHVEWTQPGLKDKMTSPIVRGMPYGTVTYEGDILPVVASQLPLSGLPLIDGKERLPCDGNSTATVNGDVELYFMDSDSTWLVFYSRPVTVYCTFSKGVRFKLNVLPDKNNDEPLVARVALANQCSSGRNAIYCDQGKANDATAYNAILREHAGVYPRNPTLKYAIPKECGIEEEPQNTTLVFDWDAHHFDGKGTDRKKKGVLMYALSHHRRLIQKSKEYANYDDLCMSTYHGTACLVSSNKWIMQEDLPKLGYTAPRPPKGLFIPYLTDSLKHDISFEIPDYFMRGAGDTYFSGKQLAKLGRIIVILAELKRLQKARTAEELKHIYPEAVLEDLQESMIAAKNVTLPTDDEFDAVFDRLRRGVQVWVNGTAETQFVYDLSWGGLVSCGCWFNGKKMGCDNAYPACPTFSDTGLDFGNGFYNDHHFHYGYHIYAAGIVAQFDPQWGRDHFEDVLLMVRDIANPSADDKHFPVVRHKDWFLGVSWASGIVTLGGQPYLNGRNQESSSEAIAAYEGVALFGSAMVDAFRSNETDSECKKNAVRAAHVRDIGRLLTASELRAADTYYHVRHDAVSEKVYPPQYSRWVVGMMWSMMAQFQTWFGNQPFLAYGIQLLPLTAVSELRDNVTWAKELYNDLAKSCEGSSMCLDQGWSVLQCAVLAEVGHPELAMSKILDLPDVVFRSAGGNGHSRSNSLWYVASRPETEPIPLLKEKKLACGHPETCTKEAQNALADDVTCIARIRWIMDTQKKPEYDACVQVARMEYPDECGACDPTLPTLAPTPSKGECGCDLTCTDAILNDVDAGGYSCGARIKYLVESQHMKRNAACAQVGGVEYGDECGGCDPNRCVNVAGLPTVTGKEVEVDDGDCGVCPTEVCESDARCPVINAPYLCYEGRNHGGCSPVPWTMDWACSKCCKVNSDCSNALG